MPDNLVTRIRRGWNAFLDRSDYRPMNGVAYSSRPDRPRFTRGNERSIANSVYNRIALDVSAIKIRHVRLDENGRFLDEIDSGLNNCLSLEANIDQSARAFIQDVVMSMFDDGCVAIVPISTSSNPKVSSSYDIYTMRTGKIVEWYTDSVRVRIYDDIHGRREEVVLPKTMVAIVENPFYSVMNEPNSTLQRLIRKLNLLDYIDEQSGSGKLDMIIQLPYTIKAEIQRKRAEQRRADLEAQLTGTKYGIAYLDATEKITQLNRPVENNLMKQIEYLTNMFYSQLGTSAPVLDGTADEATMLNYQNRTIEVIVSAITGAMKRTFLSKTARSQGQSIEFFNDPFKLVPVTQLAELVDKFTRNEVATSNEFRQVIGFKPSKDPRADELRNKNLNEPTTKGEPSTEEVDSQNGEEI